MILSQGVTPGGELAKSLGLDMVDANLLIAALPDFGLLAPDDPLMTRTVARIERDLLAEGTASTGTSKTPTMAAAPGCCSVCGSPGTISRLGAMTSAEPDRLGGSDGRP